MSVSGATLTYGSAWGYTSNKRSTSVGSSFSINTGFGTPVNLYNSVVGATLVLDLQMGPYRRWYLVMTNNI